MDFDALRPYVAPAMELLLILSAMLSAVTGAVSGGRAPETRLHHAQTAQAAAPAQRESAERIVATAPPAYPVAVEHDAPPPFALPASIPLYADRRIE